jgi:AcrR family transcriptional regulator
LEAALDELAANGGEAVALRAVADRADMALRTMYNHFTSRDELITAAFLHHAAQTRAAVEALSVPEASAEEQLRHVVEAYYSRYAEMGARLSVLLSVRGVAELDEQIELIRGRRRQLLQKIIRRAARARQLAVPVSTAVTLAYTMTSHATFDVCFKEVAGDIAEATTVVNSALSSALFRH